MANGDNDFEWAVKNGDLDMVKTFLAKNKDAAGKHLSSGRNPLVMAADYGQKDVLEYLLASGANVNGADKNQKAPNGETYYDSAETDKIKALLKQ
ncbi:hypothetical protein LSH36_337g02010 [Paralvinella palmiformis]|uniref:Ankyrin repeat domain-containing protein n=1 Tax=Paralvinella palmiformis TaxID=53620 RepID=A0AAD9JGG5_9ANNE|nr:hypothetical protein LSH36_337g02010 [Paralvinella palmiformis]